MSQTQQRSDGQESDSRTTQRAVKGVRKVAGTYHAFGSAAAEQLSAGALDVGGVPTAVADGERLVFSDATAYVRPDVHADGVMYVEGGGR